MAQNPQPWTLKKYRQVSFLLEAGPDIDPREYPSNADRIRDLLKGVVYKDKMKRYWVDADDRDCFAIYARALNITNSDDPKYWHWQKESDDVESAKVKKTKWLDVRGSFWTMNLSEGFDYEVSFRIRMEEPEEPQEKKLLDMMGKEVNLRLITPKDGNIEGQAKLPGKKLGEGPWYKLKVGQFNMTADNVGKIDFLMEASFKSWRAGLVIERVDIKAV